MLSTAKMDTLKTLKQFYDLMFGTRDARVNIVRACLRGEPADPGDTRVLASALERLNAIPQKGGRYRLGLGAGRHIDLDLTYEIGELEKDLFYLSRTEEEFIRRLEELHPGFFDHLERGRRFLAGKVFRTFITDRDGTVNNYCGRYLSSIQSAYNGVFLSRFAARSVEHAVLLTSAPLAEEGLVDISVMPPGAFIYAGSKGRELLREDGGISRYPVEPDKQHLLDRLNERLQGLLNRAAYEAFGLIGSGLQFKFGQTTVARQDMNGSIPEGDSDGFLRTVRNLVSELDPGGRVFRIEDTGRDIEIILTVESGDREGKVKDFDKGDGVSFLSETLGLELERGPNLICGDTRSDLPMVSASLEKTGDTWAVFVTEDGALQHELRSQCPNALVLPEPDMLVALLNLHAREEAA
jgi:hypothetical protein